ncbi:cation-transporting P-type ATPase [Lacimicrobium alkaliphilum]|uniref:Carbonate dehydratase n=1 Tax=Lacimicrobium alkaliphilum TaxID=1526571 RepID=A0A0U2ZKI3_9ALTE|nr:cation-transporting P-type ATPase [Lacimicrobium alkaliphilum]ALS98844.1 carbonate dehydratase [Lacimicrobium alkaliphilum]
MTDWHTKSGEEVQDSLQSTAEGLSSELAQQRLAENGPNRLPEVKGKPAWLRFLLQFHNILIYVLLISALITALLGHWLDTTVILAVVLVNAIIGYVQEGKAEQAMQSLRNMLAPNASVIRDGKRQTIPATDLVIGDLVLLEAGDKVPADMRLLKAHNLSIQEAILTGESVAVNKNTDRVSIDAPLGERSGMAFSGTFVGAGQGRGLVVATGAATEIGKINRMLGEVEQLTTPLVEQMAGFAKWLSALILVVAGILLIVGYSLLNYPFTELFMIIVGLSVAAIPEGLPAVLTITLAIGVQAMARRHAIVRRLPSIETLGAVSVICTDKTGTLTRNEMTVTQVQMPAQDYQVEGSGYAPTGAILDEQQKPLQSTPAALESAALTALLCNDAALHEQQGQWSIQGDPMEAALLSFALKAGLNQQDSHKDWPRTDAIPFDSEHKFMASLHHDHQGNGRILVKGAPEKLINLCTRVQGADSTNEIDRGYWAQQAQDMAAQGQRVLALAVKEVPGEHNLLKMQDLDEGLCLQALIGIMDPPREEAVHAVANCLSAGIKVKMITGDHPGTAQAIGKKIGLQNTEKVLTGAEIESMDDAALALSVNDVDIYARTSPQHKLRLVMALQSHHLTVAMTGDGVNDAPALKRADAGIAMGLKGSEAAKEAADLVLADDNFATIAAAVEQGRTVYDNIKKVISWTLPTNGGEATTIIVALLLGMSLPITALQILWVNLITATTLGLALAFEPTEAGTMQRPPRHRHAPIVSGVLAWQVVLVSLLFLAGMFGIFSYANARGDSIELARTLALNTLVIMEMFYLFFIRHSYSTSFSWQAIKGTPVVWLMVGIVIVAQLAITYLPFMQQIFDTRPVSLTDGLFITGIGICLFMVVELEKQIRLRLTSFN